MYKLAIAAVVKFQIKLSVNDGGVKKDFSVWLEGKRVSSESLQTDIDENGEMKLVDFHKKVCRDNFTGWSDQRLVVADDGRPADFSEEALECLLSLPGAATVAHSAYMEALVASAGPVGRLKNS